MELDTFITAALTQVLKGIADANKNATAGKSTEKAPKPFLLKHGGTKEEGSGIEFDIAVTLKKTRGAKGGGKATFLSVAELEAGGHTSNTNEQISRIKFMVFVNQWQG
jgi:hypothetical protein